jgi:acyl-coenzyme A synthetase/AMP-(fatty) acid ligase
MGHERHGRAPAESLGQPHRPARARIVDALPRNASGKVMKTALRQEYR